MGCGGSTPESGGAEQLPASANEFDALIAAVMKQDVGFIHAFGGDVNQLSCTRSKDWWTPETPPPPGGYRALVVAVREDKVESVKALLAKGADLSLADSMGNKPLDLAMTLSRDACKAALREALIGNDEGRGSVKL